MLLSDVIHNYNVPAASSSLLMSGLVPGASYSLQVVTMSGGLGSKAVSLEGRTSEYSKQL